MRFTSVHSFYNMCQPEWASSLCRHPSAFSCTDLCDCPFPLFLFSPPVANSSSIIFLGWGGCYCQWQSKQHDVFHCITTIHHFPTSPHPSPVSQRKCSGNIYTSSNSPCHSLAISQLLAPKRGFSNRNCSDLAFYLQSYSGLSSLNI
jgi:hypothetical protein